jgi:hypothetical protein
MVCKKVEEKGTTTYSQVADELVQHVLQNVGETAKYDVKNIRRRVYDALNVLMAMDVIVKRKKDIIWQGLPATAAQDVALLRRELDQRQREVERKRGTLQELLAQHVCFRNLVAHNAARRQAQPQPPPPAARAAAAVESSSSKNDHKIPLPFIVINTSSAAIIQCNMSRDLTDVMFDFTLPFEINDDNTILKRMGMYVGCC